MMGKPQLKGRKGTKMGKNQKVIFKKPQWKIYPQRNFTRNLSMSSKNNPR